MSFDGLHPTEALFGPPLTPPFSHRGGVSSYGVRRWRDSQVSGFDRDYPSVHGGIDLVSAAADDEGAVYSCYWGQIVEINTEDRDASGNVVKENIAIWCDPGPEGRILLYRHIVRRHTLANGTVVDAGLEVGDRVRAGQLIGFISPASSDPHLHFELRLQSESTGLIDRVAAFQQDTITSAPVDPTPLLYRFDANRWPRKQDAQIEDFSTENYQQIERIRIVPWVVQHSPGKVRWHTQYFLQVLLAGDPGGGFNDDHRFYVPVEMGIAREEAVVDLLKEAFHHGHRVRLRGRRSWFFGERSMVEDVRVRRS